MTATISSGENSATATTAATTTRKITSSAIRGTASGTLPSIDRSGVSVYPRGYGAQPADRIERSSARSSPAWPRNTSTASSVRSVESSCAMWR